MMQNYPDEVIITGYFTGSDPSSAKILAITKEQYDQLQLRGIFRPRQTRQLPRAVDLKGRLLSCQSY